MMNSFLFQMSMHTSHSVSCVDECGKRHAKGLNVFELCEQHSYTDQLLTNVDFLCRLNFFANRFTEQIAEVAARDIRSFYRHQTNPRARYFSDIAVPSHSNSDAMEEEEERQFVSFVFISNSFAFELLYIFAIFYPFITFSPSPSPTSFKRVHYIHSNQSITTLLQRGVPTDGSMDILHLVRRSSGVDSRSSDSSPIPDYALVGLSQAERDHVRKVLENARKSSHSPAVSRRPSSALPLHEMGDFSDSERAHIQQVLEKAESRGSSPFVIRVPSHGRVGRTDSTISYDTPTPPSGRIITQTSFSDDDYSSSMRSIDNAIRRATERQSSLRKSSENSPKVSLQEEEKEKIISTTENLSLLPTTLPTETPILTPSPDHSPVRLSSHLLEKEEYSPKRPELSIQGFKRFFGKTSNKVVNMTKKVSEREDRRD
ncbi:hypothetical protein PENTCL1PPCAC_17752 [Pristionchus entomophagus]|uniref:Uncharacterized protein n=1 Tax=Pristionchus entomophagus TaxID=358040 RepID=A0AAV5TMI8_9BILA|nr:hypothetical protein PENTCL1PPCAC_17752 [Pristionchus entomophagus]